MGHEIFYCSGCQTQLRGADFEKGNAIRDASNAWCATCYPGARRPARPAPLNTESPRKGTRSIPVLRTETPRKSTASIPIVAARPKTARRAKSDGKNAVPVLVGAAAGVVLLVLAMTAGSGPKRTDDAEPGRRRAAVAEAPRSAAPAPAVREAPEEPRMPPRGRAKASRPEDVLRELREMLAAPRTPAEILMRIEQEEASFRGGPLERDLAEIRKQAEVLRAKADPDRDVELLVQEIRAVLDSKDAAARQSDVDAMLAAARSLGGKRQGEVRELAERAEALFKAARPDPATSADPLEVLGLTLVNLETGKPIPGYEKLENGAVIDANRFDPRIAGIRAQVRGPLEKAVRFDLDGKQEYRLEVNEPYDLDGTGTAGPMQWLSKPGRHELTVVPLRGKDGPAGKPLKLSFSVVPRK